MAGIPFDPMIDALTKALTLRQQRHEVLASNLANVETPGFVARDLDFGSVLKDAFKAAEGMRPSTLEARVVADESAPPRADGNTVDVDMQMAKLSQNAGSYTALARILKHEFEHLRMVIDTTR